MAGTSAQTRSLGLAAPIGVLAALLVAGGIFVAPMPFLTPPPAALPPVETPKVEEAPAIIPLPPPWVDLAPAFTALREPPIEIESPVDPGTPAGVQTAESAPPVQLNWRYIGYIEEPRRLVGVLMVDAAQHLVAPGETIRDPNQPEGKPVTITGVAPDKLTIDYHGRAMDFPLSKAESVLQPGVESAGAVVHPPGTPPAVIGTPPGGRATMPGSRRNPMNRPTPGPNRPSQASPAPAGKSGGAR